MKANIEPRMRKRVTVKGLRMQHPVLTIYVAIHGDKSYAENAKNHYTYCYGRTRAIWKPA